MISHSGNDKTGEERLGRRKRQVEALFNPRNIVIVGATDKPGNWTSIVQRVLRRYGYEGRVFPYNPRRDEVWGEKCYRTFQELPEPPDQLLVLVPAAGVVDILREGAASGARSATVMTSGFEEAGGEGGRKLARELRDVIAETGLAVSGPNCMGNMIGPYGVFTLADERPQGHGPGPVAIVGQSGGLAMAIKRTLEERGVAVGHLVTSGNEAGLTTGDYIRYLVDDPGTRIIVSYLEGVRDRDSFLDACRAAHAAGKPVIVVKLGVSSEGRAAALAHTGALAGAIKAFDAVVRTAGVIRVDTLDDVVEAVELLLHAKLPAGGNLGAVTVSGGLRGMLIDAQARNDLKFPKLSAETAGSMTHLLGAGSAIGNPLDSGYAAIASHQTYLECVRLMLADPGIDALLLQGELPRAPVSEERERQLRELDAMAAAADKPIAYVSMISYGLTEYARKLRADLPHLTFLQEPNKALRAVRHVVDHALSRRPTGGGADADKAGLGRQIDRLKSLAAASDKAFALSEPDSKALLATYGIVSPREAVVQDAEAAVTAAKSIGFPVVLKAVSADLPHKTEAGAVLVGLGSEEAVRAGWQTIQANVARAAPGLMLEGVLVAEMVAGGLELTMGISNDPEVGPVLMFGQGGTALELYGDVAFADPLLDEEAASDLIDRTKAGTLINGFRGHAGFDRMAIQEALIALGGLARDLGDLIEAVDVNPLVVRKDGGVVALDGLVILRGLAHAQEDA